MRPDDDKTRTKAQAVGAAKLQLKDALGWLHGFPVGRGQGTVRWKLLPPAGSRRPVEEIAIDREHLRRAEYTSERLVARFPRVLPRLVGNRAEWSAGVTARLEHLKATIHHGAPLPTLKTLLPSSGFSPEQRKRILDIESDHPGLRPLLLALVWIHLGSPSGLRAPVSVVHGHAACVETGLTLDATPERLHQLLAVCELASVDGESCVQGVLEALRQELDLTTALKARQDRLLNLLQGARQQGSGRDSPSSAIDLKTPPSLHLRLWAWVEEVLQLDRAGRRHALRLFDLVRPREGHDAWATWWREYQKAIEQRYSGSPTRSVRRLKKCKRRVERLKASSPSSYPDMGNLLDAIRSIAVSWEPSLRERLLKMVRALPEVHRGIPVRARLVSHWHCLANIRDNSSRFVDPVLRTFQALLTGGRAPRGSLDIWLPFLAEAPNSSWLCPESHFMHGQLDKALLPEIVPACEAILPFPLTELQTVRAAVVLLVDLLAVFKNGNLAGRTLRCLLEEPLPDSFVEDATIEAAWMVGRGQPQAMARTLRTLIGTEQQSETARNLVLLARTVESPHLVEEMIRGGELSRVAAVAGRLRLLQSLTSPEALERLPRLRTAGLKRDPRKAAGLQKWLNRYPEPLHRPLKQLARVDTQARRNAHRVLGAAFPDPTRLHKEAEVLRNRLQNLTDERAQALQTRLHNLESRLQGPEDVSRERLARLATKLRARIRLARLRAWDQGLKEKLQACIAEHLGATDFREWLEDGHRVRLLTAVGSLVGASRELGLRLLRLREGPPPRDLREAPRNREFLERLRQMGLDPAPWIDGLPPHRYTTTADSERTLALEDDPLEVLRMGEHFDTCLSPEGFNFFSAITNAADINKRILYARDEDGKVRGRCLLAITTEGRLLTFRPYTHDEGEDFGKEVAEFTSRLAREMGTVCTNCGEVETLLSGGWYDDGPQDLTGRFRFLEEGSSLRERLKSVPPDELLDCLAAEMAPVTLDVHTLPQLLALDEMQLRPELVLPLLPGLSAMPRLNVETNLRVARLCREAGADEEARRLVRSIIVRVASADWWSCLGAIELLLDLDEPTLALQLIRRTREKGVRRWEDEHHRKRLLFVARAHDALHRHRAALGLYRRCLGYDFTLHWKDHCRNRVRELEALLESGRG